MENKPVVIVTGASRGLGEATAYLLARQGARVTLNARTRPRLQEVAEKVAEMGGEALIAEGSVGDEEVCARIVQSTLDRWGRIDALVNNAAVITPIGSYTGVNLRDWREAVEVNLLGPLYLARLAAGALKESKGRIVNISTGAAVHPLPAWSAYCATKAGLHHLTRTMAVEERDIIALSLRPGVVDTEMQVQIRRDGPAHMPADLTQYFQSLKETGRLEPPEVPARAIAWLALHAPADWSGEMIEYTDPRVVQAAHALFG